jgi:3-oxoacyl-(acyl-carrier-protein) synthase
VIAPVSIAAWAVRTPLGDDVERVVARLCAGESAARPNPHAAYRCQAIAPVMVAPAASRNQRYLSVMGLHAMEVATEAFATSGLAAGPRLGVFAAVGGLRAHWNDILPAFREQRDDGAGAWERGLRDIHPFWMLRHLSNNAHALLAGELGARGDGATYAGATAGASALAGAARALETGSIDAAVVVAYDSLLEPETLVELGERRAAWCGGAADLPAPYQENSAGFVPGEAAAALVLVPGDRAGLAQVRAVAGADSTVRALARLGCGADVIDGAARAWPDLDGAERDALADVLDPGAILTATTAALGQLGAATAVVQAITLAAALRRRTVPPIAGLRAPSAGPFALATTAMATRARSAVDLSTGVPGLVGVVHVEVPA